MLHGEEIYKIPIGIFLHFSNTFARVQQNSETLWWYERYTAIHDYQWRVPSPFNVLFIPYRIYTVCKKNRCLQNDIGSFRSLKLSS